MDIKRVLLYGALALLGYFIWMNWQIDYPHLSSNSALMSPNQALLPQPEKTLINQLNPPISAEASKQGIPATLESSAKENVSASKIYVNTDVLKLSIDTKEGDIVNAALLHYAESTDPQSKPLILLQDNPSTQYVANSGLIVLENQQVKPLILSYQSPADHYDLHPGEKNLSISLTGKTAEGLVVKKTFVLTRGSYVIDVLYEIVNQGNQPWTGYFNTQLLRSSPTEDKSSFLHMGSFTGASYSQPGVSKFKKLSFKDMAKSNLDLETSGGWIAMQQHYFLSAWIPEASTAHRFYSRSVGDDYTIGQVSKAITIAPQQSKTVSSKLYLGPEITEVLKSIAPGLDLTVDYGWLWFISQFLFSVMKFIYSWIGNWGWSVILVTLMIKIAFFRLQATSFKSMARMRHLQPKIAALKERYGDDKAKLSQATMELYKQEKVNPLGGCLPIIIQIPVFISLYWVLVESVELRHAPFILWIHDLASADPYHVLPILMGLTMLIQQKLNPTPPDPTQAKVMMFLPVVFTIMFLNFPAGLVLYWSVNNSLSILQQWYITQKFSDAATPKKLARKK